MGENIMNPTTVVEMDEDSYMEMETTQIKGWTPPSAPPRPSWAPAPPSSSRRR